MRTAEKFIVLTSRFSLETITGMRNSSSVAIVGDLVSLLRVAALC